VIRDEILRSIRQRLVDGFGPEKIILFGSQASGEADDRSDVDILVVCSFEGKRRKLMLEMDRALGGLDYAFDVLVLRPEEFRIDSLIAGTVGRYASQEGKVLYERN
jgi:predicted nucleotidyltransferase